MRSFVPLRRRAEFAALRRRGRLNAQPTMLLYRAEPKASDRRSHAAVTVDTAVGKAVVRNTVRRRIASALHDALASRPPQRVLVIARPAAASAPFARLRGDLLTALDGR